MKKRSSARENPLTKPEVFGHLQPHCFACIPVPKDAVAASRRQSTLGASGCLEGEGDVDPAAPLHSPFLRQQNSESSRKRCSSLLSYIKPPIPLRNCSRRISRQGLRTNLVPKSPKQRKLMRLPSRHCSNSIFVFYFCALREGGTLTLSELSPAMQSVHPNHACLLCPS
jgi:hypothetical protein